jgi:hypothetical protein
MSQKTILSESSRKSIHRSAFGLLYESHVKKELRRVRHTMNCLGSAHDRQEYQPLSTDALLGAGTPAAAAILPVTQFLPPFLSAPGA